MKAIELLKKEFIGKFFIGMDTSGKIFNIRFTYDYEWVGFEIHLERGEKIKVDLDYDFQTMDLK